MGRITVAMVALVNENKWAKLSWLELIKHLPDNPLLLQAGINQSTFLPSLFSCKLELIKYLPACPLLLQAGINQSICLPSLFSRKLELNQVLACLPSSPAGWN
jgi:hypothetical protein